MSGRLDEKFKWINLNDLMILRFWPRGDCSRRPVSIPKGDYEGPFRSQSVQSVDTSVVVICHVILVHRRRWRPSTVFPYFKPSYELECQGNRSEKESFFRMINRETKIKEFVIRKRTPICDTIEVESGWEDRD